MSFRVVRPFPYSEDGLTLIGLVSGDEREDFAGMEVGLVAEGYIVPVGDAPAAAPAVLQLEPEDEDEDDDADDKPAPRRGRARK